MSDFSKYLQDLKALKADLDDSSKRIVDRVTHAGLTETKRKTPVGQYSSGKQGGNLQRMWVKSITHKDGRDWVGGYANNVYYGSYVNDGHRVVNKKGETVGYVTGKRFLEKGMDKADETWESAMQAEIDRIKKKGGW